METPVTIYTFSVLGLSFVFQGHFLSAFIFLYGLFFLLMLFDVFTRMQIERKINGTNSGKGREGLTAKSKILATMFFVAMLVYFTIGYFDNQALSISASLALTMIMVLYVMYELISIVENQLESAEINNVKANPVTALLSKLLGIVYNKVESKLLKDANEKD